MEQRQGWSKVTWFQASEEAVASHARNSPAVTPPAALQTPLWPLSSNQRRVSIGDSVLRPLSSFKVHLRQPQDTAAAPAATVYL